jgi:hypothetical protein
MTALCVYRESAAVTLHLAQRATNSSDKNRLLSLAEKWLALADRAVALGAAPDYVVADVGPIEPVSASNFPCYQGI